MERFLPSPFNNPVDVSAATVETVAVLNSTLTCMYCFHESTEGTYHPEKEVLVWDCDGCGETNIVKGIKI